MTHIQISRYLIQRKSVKLESLYREFNIKTESERKAVTKILHELETKGSIKMNPKTKIISTIDNKSNSDNKSRNVNSEKQSKYSSIKEERKIVKFTQAVDDFKIIAEKYSLPESFPYSVNQEIKNKIWEKDQLAEQHRKDLRDLFVVTIDGADSKDLDDGVSIHKSIFGVWTLGVHIADVSHYVPQDSALDKEAFERANSYYLIDKVIPMLPKELSNELCSLNPCEDKRAMSILIKFNSKGIMLSYEIVPSWIKSAYRLTYDRVEELIQGAVEKDAKLLKNIKLMDKLFRILNHRRMNDGSIEFNFKEKKIKLDSQGNPTTVYQKDRLDSERLIEEFMLAANQGVGDFLYKKGLGLYRVHDIPPTEKYQKLKTFAAKKGIKLPDVPKPQDLQRFVSQLVDTPIQISGEILTLRSMSQAVYQRENIGHFGLGFALYAHFTSPIRRYADLIVHRLIKYFLFAHNQTSPYTEQVLDKIASHISSQERVALEAERDFFKIKCVRYMKPFEGKSFDGVISSVAHFGMFIEMKDTGIEAMIRYSDMSDYIIFDEEELQARNRKGNKIYKIGDPIMIRITKVNEERGFIDAEEISFEK